MTTYRTGRPAAAVFAALTVAALPAIAQQGATQQSAAPTPPRTVSWYADNPQARARVQLACIEGIHALDKGDCELLLRGGARVPCSRQYKGAVVEWLNADL